MADAIPIRNLYHMLLYAWGMLEMRELVPVGADDPHDVTHLLARMLEEALRRQWRHGLAHGYVLHTEEAPRIRGRIDFGESLRRQSFERRRAVCHADDWSPDILPNRIIRSTLDELLRWRPLDCDRAAALRRLRDPLAEVAPRKLGRRDFRACRFQQRDRLYRYILNVCELLQSRLLAERRTPGLWRVRDFFQDEGKMPALFEKFVRAFYQRHAVGARVGASGIEWDVTCDAIARSHLPGMKTDVVLEWSDRKIILDCKYYREAFTHRFDTDKLHSANLYQLYAYLRNQAVVPGWEHCEGVLLYPATGVRFDLRYEFGAHAVRIASLDLSAPWREVEESLRALAAG